MHIFLTVLSILDNCLFVPQKCETCLVTHRWKGFGCVCRAHLKPSQNTRSKFSMCNICLLWKCVLACSWPQLVYKAALMEDVTFRPPICKRTGSFGYKGRLYGPICDRSCRHSCASLSARMLSCSGIVSNWNAVVESACPKTCWYVMFGARDIRFSQNENKTSACDCFSERLLRGLLPWWTTPMLSQYISVLLRGALVYLTAVTSRCVAIRPPRSSPR